MAKSDWRAPFLQFRDNIRPLFDNGVEIYHGVVMAPFHRRSMVRVAVRKLKAAKAGKIGIAAIETPTRECDHHAHYFFGDKGAYVALGNALSGVEDWIQSAPPGLLPRFGFPSMTEGIKKDIVTWACLVYYLAWKLNLPYLRAICEFRPLIAEGAVEPWSKWPHQPKGLDLRPLLVHQGTFPGDLEPLKMQLAECKKFYYFPDIIAGHLANGKSIAEFIGASLAAVDALVFILDQFVAMKAAKSRGTRGLKYETKKAKTVIDNVTLLKAFLYLYHCKRNSQFRVKGKSATDPLTAVQIGRAMGWSQSTASRTMEDMLGLNGMAKYKSKFISGKIHPGFRTLLSDGSRAIDAIAASDHDEKEFDKK